MENDFIKEQAKQFAKVVHSGTGKYDSLKVLRERLNQELDNYLDVNKKSFLEIWKQELDFLLDSHLARCSDPKCPQRLTSKNAEFLTNQFLSNNVKPTDDNMKNTLNHDLNFYFNTKNIANSKLVMQTYNYFLKDGGKKYFEPLTFFNLLYWHYEYLNSNVDRPFDVLTKLRNVDLDEIRKQILFGFILKWFGGVPVNNMDAQYDSVLKLIESDFLEYNRVKFTREIELRDKKKANKALTDAEEKEFIELQIINSFLAGLVAAISNDQERRELANAELILRQSLFSTNESKALNSSDKSIQLFVSHSSKDKEVVELFVDKILRLSLRVEIEKIFCTSIESTTIDTGEDFRMIIKSKLQKASHVIQIISENYKASEICLNEMGAAWVLNSKVIPFILPPLTYNSVGFIHSPNQLLKLNEEKDLLKFIDEMKIQTKSLKHTEVSRHVSDFIRGVKR